eukprot:gene8819-6203_t
MKKKQLFLDALTPATNGSHTGNKKTTTKKRPFRGSSLLSTALSLSHTHTHTNTVCSIPGYDLQTTYCFSLSFALPPPLPPTILIERRFISFLRSFSLFFSSSFAPYRREKLKREDIYIYIYIINPSISFFLSREHTTIKNSRGTLSTGDSPFFFSLTGTCAPSCSRAFFFLFFIIVFSLFFLFNYNPFLFVSSFSLQKVKVIQNCLPQRSLFFYSLLLSIIYYLLLLFFFYSPINKKERQTRRSHSPLIRAFIFTSFSRVSIYIYIFRKENKRVRKTKNKNQKQNKTTTSTGSFVSNTFKDIFFLYPALFAAIVTIFSHPGTPPAPSHLVRLGSTPHTYLNTLF